mgnify:CR=1 FL=1
MEVYLHIPFCRVKCDYCALHSFAGREHLVGRYSAALRREIRCVGNGETVASIYFGGGTPSLLTPGLVGALLETCADVFALADDVEITLEAHPATVSTTYLRDLRACGVNRLSFGVQSAHDDILRGVGRMHTVAQAGQALAWARAAGFDNVGLDLIYGLPGDSLARWRETLAHALAWEPDHVSAYALAVECGTRLARRINAGQVAVADADQMAEMYDAAGEAFARAGLGQYELSNWARPGKACRHNLSVWRGGEYLGLGAGAHGFAAGVRYQVVGRLDAYLRRMTRHMLYPEPCLFPRSPAVARTHRLSRREMMEEAMFLGLRLTEEGVSGARFAARFGRKVEDVFGAELEELLALGLLERRGDAIRLTPRARLISNQVFVHFVKTA